MSNGILNTRHPPDHPNFQIKNLLRCDPTKRCTLRCDVRFVTTENRSGNRFHTLASNISRPSAWPALKLAPR